MFRKTCPRLTLSTSSNIRLVSGTSGALGTVTIIGVRVRPRVPMEAVFTTWGWLGAPGGAGGGRQEKCKRKVQ
uniref:Uncharacterized protein n=1 Tax=Knipowitschia caucasica TaxID=637954 RepID=A0AAV2L776_KNICA